MGFDFSKYASSIFTVKAKEEKEMTTDTEVHEAKVSYEQYGVRQAAAMHGSTEGLKICLNRVFQEHLADMRRDGEQQEKLRKPYKEKMQELISDNETIRSQVKTLESDIIPTQQKRIEELTTEIGEIRQNPEQHAGHGQGKFAYYFGAIILAFLSIYLFIFYSSASYSALFKEFKIVDMGEDSLLTKAIFDSKAITNAFRDGTTELILIITIPFVFIGLGYLMHKFQEQKEKTKYLKIAGLIFVTFIFDFILAFEITKKIYDLEAGGKFQESAPYSVALAFQSVNFWLIIFAGFIVYLIWGFVFDFFMEAHAKLDYVRVKIKIKQERIQVIEAELQKHEEEVVVLKKKCDINVGEINKLKETINCTIIHPREVTEALSQFMVGWYKYLAIGRIYSRKEHNDIYDQFLAQNVTRIESLINLN